MRTIRPKKLAFNEEIGVVYVEEMEFQGKPEEYLNEEQIKNQELTDFEVEYI
ncbi:MAG: hypothetical protein K6D97_06660 [Clostridia bacterium]|nr:hypothetical protein [Clostridia bacterium]